MKRYVLPLLTLMIGYLVYHLSHYYLSVSSHNVIMVILAVVVLFVFGISMSTRSRNRSTWVKKTVIIVLTAFVLAVQLGYLNDIREVNFIVMKLRASGNLLFDMLYVYFGFIFF